MTSMSEKCGISPRHLANIEHGRISPSYDMLFSIVHELAISADFLFYPDMPDADKRTKLFLTQYNSCSAEHQDFILDLVGCLVYNLQKAND